jgi:hypothetical protein
MPATTLRDDLAALDVVAAVVQQARKDISRRQVAACHRVSAFLLLAALAEEEDRDPDRQTSGEDRATIRVARGGRFEGGRAGRERRIS